MTNIKINSLIELVLQIYFLVNFIIFVLFYIELSKKLLYNRIIVYECEGNVLRKDTNSQKGFLK